MRSFARSPRPMRVNADKNMKLRRLLNDQGPGALPDGRWQRVHRTSRHAEPSLAAIDSKDLPPAARQAADKVPSDPQIGTRAPIRKWEHESDRVDARGLRALQ